MRTLKFILALGLLPLCWAMTGALARLLIGLRAAGAGGISAAWFLGGLVVWLILFSALPPPTRTYILAHELTHALWTWLMGGEVKKIRVGRSSGSVVVTRDNFLISLAPYFFPLYSILVILLWYGLSLFWDLSTYEPFWMAVVGLSWGFHLTFTANLLRQRQPDILAHGRLFSYCVIYLLNLAGLGLWVVIVSRRTLPDLISVVRAEAIFTYSTLLQWGGTLWQGIRQVWSARGT